MRRFFPSLQRVAAGVLIAAIIALAFLVSKEAVLTRLISEAQVTAQARVQTLESILAVQRAVAVTLADDGLARRALRNPASEDAHQVSLKLEHLHEETGSTIIYLLDAEGMTISSSNWNEPISFVGGDYSFRKYYLDAVAKGEAFEYALGKDSFRPGLYLSQALIEDDVLLGVIVVKMEFEAMEAAWSRSRDLSFVTNAEGQVVLASDEAWRFGAPPEVGARIAVHEAVKGSDGWQLTVMAPSVRAFQAGLYGGFAAALLCALFLLLRQRRLRALRALTASKDAASRYQRDLEQAVEDRTAALKAEMEERRGTEKRLANMQGELVQANKLATLGQVTAGLAHEVNQPLATIRLLADNGVALLDHDVEAVRQNLNQISGMTERIDRITTHLRGFARKATGELRAVSVKEVIEASILLTASRRRVGETELVIKGADPSLLVRAEAVRLEQVLVNLIQNAQEALHGTPHPLISLTVRKVDDHVEFEVRDNGPGIPPELQTQVFMPFVTSKSEGLGLGLVIARDIARDLGGDLILAPSEQGACFILKVKSA